MKNPFASASGPLLDRVFVAFIRGPATEPGVEFPSCLGFAKLAPAFTLMRRTDLELSLTYGHKEY